MNTQTQSIGEQIETILQAGGFARFQKGQPGFSCTGYAASTSADLWWADGWTGVPEPPNIAEQWAILLRPHFTLKSYRTAHGRSGFHVFRK